MKKNLQKGTTLLETMIYLGLLSFIMTTALVSVYHILSVSGTNASKSVTESEANFINAKINWALSGATVTLPVANTTGSSLQVTKDLNTIIITRSGNDATIKIGSAAALVLNSGRSKITALSFKHVQQTGSTTTDSIKTSFDIDGKHFEYYRKVR